MDLDAFVETHRHTWARLETLVERRPVTGAQADEMIALYQEVATHLSLIRSDAPDPSVVVYLSNLLARTRTRTGHGRQDFVVVVAHFFRYRFPAALYRTRRVWLTTMLVSYLCTGLAMWWFTQNPQFEQSLMTQDEIDQLVNEDFANYYTQASAGDFSAKVWTNNALVSAQAIAFGVLGFPILYILVMNMGNLALVGGLMMNNDRGSLFWGLILPHGLIELTAVFVACGVGLKLFFGWVVPGDVPRHQSLAKEARSGATIVLGLVVVLLISGLIEGFVTPSSLPTWARILIGILAEVTFLLYVYIPGKQAVRLGYTGDADSARLSDVLPTRG